MLRANRRHFLTSFLKCAAALSVSPEVFGQQRSNGITTTRLTDNIMQISGAGGNVVVAKGADGLVVVNGGLAEHSGDVLKILADQFGNQRVATLFNTDWHPENTGLNETLGTRGAKIIAHEYTKLYLSEEIVVDWQNRTYKPLPKTARPNHTFHSGKMARADGIDYGHLGQAHTDGDIYVYFREANVLIAGEVLSVGKYPIPDYTTGGWLGGLLNANKTLLDLSNDQTRIVPGTGPVQTRADLQAQHDMLATLRERFIGMIRKGMGPEDIVAAAATKEFDEKWGDSAQFVNIACRGMFLHVRELGGIV